MEAQAKLYLQKLFTKWSGKQVSRLDEMTASASYRQYCRLWASDGTSAIGAYNTDIKENQAFIYLSKHFRTKELQVPSIYTIDINEQTYLQQDLGNTTLWKFIQAEWAKNGTNAFTNTIKEKYQQAIDQLVRIQILGHEQLDYSYAYPRPAFDAQSIQWDCNYFKYYFLKLAKIPFDEQLLENDFRHLIHYLQQVKSNYFMLRDCQSRNIMIHNQKVYFIDYQGGRQGALQYDLASLLYQSRVKIPQHQRDELLQYYMKKASALTSIEQPVFTQQFYAFLLIRLLQLLGAYGFRGFYERKRHFLRSISPTLVTLKWLLQQTALANIEIPYLLGILKKMLVAPSLQQFNIQVQQKNEVSKLVVNIRSFSYKNGIPKDTSGHGGGFVFDCRAIKNPGRLAAYKKLTGRDQAVINYLHEQSRIRKFMQDVQAIVEPSVERYLQRGFEYLSINFGCTGGQHRSVYCADALADHLRTKYGVQVRLQHLVQDAKRWVN